MVMAGTKRRSARMPVGPKGNQDQSTALCVSVHTVFMKEKVTTDDCPTRPSKGQSYSIAGRCTGWLC